MSRVIYLYGFVPGAAAKPDPSLQGLDGSDVELLPGPGFRAVVSRLQAEAYTAEEVEARLRDVAWVADRAVAHERVVAWFVDNADIVPARLLTLYSSEEALSETAHSERERIADLLGRFAGLREWDLKVSYRPSELGAHIAELSPEIAALDAQLEDAAPGRRFLLGRKRDDVVKAELGRAARLRAGQLLQELQEHAREAIGLGTSATEAELPVALNVALLVEASRTDALRRLAAERRHALEAQGFVVGLSGPWAPYRFMGNPDDE